MNMIDQSTFLVLLSFFVAAGIIGRRSVWVGILLPWICVPSLLYYLGDTEFMDVLGNVISGLLTGVSGVVIIPLFWVGRKGRPASNMRFIHTYGSGKAGNSPSFNWVKNDKPSEPGRGEWTDKDYN